MPTTLTHRRASARVASLLAALALAALLSLLAPRPAPARAPATGHRPTTQKCCPVKRARTVTKRRRAHTCSAAAKPTIKTKSRKRVPTPRGGLTVEQVGGSGSPAPVMPAGPGEPAPPPKPRGGKTVGNLPVESGETVSDPIDPRFLTDVTFGTRSFWVQPWRAYLDTWPASRLLEAVGINFNVAPPLAEDTAQLLHNSGFKLARIGINWSALSYSDPTAFIPARLADIDTRLTALHRHGLRPLIVLDAYSGAPTPATNVTLETTAAAPVGAQTVTLSASSAAEVVPRKTGFDGLLFNGAPDELITSLNGNVATLARPLRSPLTAGAHPASTLLYAPFAAPTLAGGQPNPVFQVTLAGWLNYISQVCKQAASVVGPEGYDLEVWNELSFDSQFLNAENYYSPSGEENPEEVENNPEAERAVSKEIRKTLLAATVGFVRNPANGIPAGVGITDGFASQTPFRSGAEAPLGLTALSKHPYASVKSYPAEDTQRNIAPLDALGARDTSSNESFAPLFTPTYQSLLPEYALTASSTETLIRDIAPITTNVYHFPHGRNVGPAGGQPLQKWVTEYNLAIGKAKVIGPDGVTPQAGPSATLTAADRAHFQAKVALRSLISMVAKGESREYFYAAAPGNLSLIDPSFFTAAEAQPGVYPGDALGGETMTGLHNTLTHFQGPGPEGGNARQLTLISIAQNGNHAQFTGDGTNAHPSLYDRDVLAVFPFQTSPTSYVIPVYVMTRDLLTLYEPNAPSSDVGRFDLPDETFRVTLGNLPQTATAPTVASYDPLHDESTPARLVSREGDQATIEVASSDYPRLLSVSYKRG
jgi:hypothetical protein